MCSVAQPKWSKNGSRHHPKDGAATNPNANEIEVNSFVFFRAQVETHNHRRKMRDGMEHSLSREAQLSHFVRWRLGRARTEHNRREWVAMSLPFCGAALPVKFVSLAWTFRSGTFLNSTISEASRWSCDMITSGCNYYKRSCLSEGDGIAVRELVARPRVGGARERHNSSSGPGSGKPFAMMNGFWLDGYSGGWF